MEGIVDFKPKQRSSNTWQGIIWGSELLREGLRWKVKNGERVSFWKYKWLHKSSLLQSLTQTIGEKDQQAAVRSFWEDYRGWKGHKFSGSLPAMMLLKLATIHLDTTTHASDEVSWLDWEGGMFTVKSTHELGTGKKTMPVWEGWKLVWRLKIQQRAKVLCRCLLMSIFCLTNFVGGSDWLPPRIVVVLMVDGRMPYTHCEASKEVWDSLLSPELVSMFYFLDMRSYVLFNLRHKGHAGEGGATAMARDVGSDCLVLVEVEKLRNLQK